MMTIGPAPLNCGEYLEVESEEDALTTPPQRVACEVLRYILCAGLPGVVYLPINMNLW